jgi:hypothetical protein
MPANEVQQAGRGHKSRLPHLFLIESQQEKTTLIIHMWLPLHPVIPEPYSLPG